jgi:hypothetical protein
LLGKNIEAINAQLCDISASVDLLNGMVHNFDGVVTRLYINLISEQRYKRKRLSLLKFRRKCQVLSSELITSYCTYGKHIIEVRTTCSATSQSRMTPLHGLSQQSSRKAGVCLRNSTDIFDRNGRLYSRERVARRLCYRFRRLGLRSWRVRETLRLVPAFVLLLSFDRSFLNFRH